MAEQPKIFSLGFPWDTPDPFLFCVHHLDHYPRGNPALGPDASLKGRNLGNDFTIKDGWRMYHGQTVPGFPAHPHCGFETVTIVNRGFCDHADSLGASARFGEGDVQWITTGAGLQHSEMFPLLNPDGPNTLELFQIWLNLPASSKRVSPYFSMLWNESIPEYEGDDIRIRLIAGQLAGLQAPEPPPDSWAADPDNGVGIALIDLGAGGAFSFPAVEEHINRRLYLFQGSEVVLDETMLPAGKGAVLPARSIELNGGSGNSRLLMLAGKSIEEPVVKYGPFVMNTQEEIEKAFEEFRLTRFGGWPWRHPDPVHDAGRGRFAVFPDGKEVEM